MNAIGAYEEALKSGSNISLLSGEIYESLGDIAARTLNRAVASLYYRNALIHYKPLHSGESGNIIRVNCKLGNVYKEDNELLTASQYYNEALSIPVDRIHNKQSLCIANACRGVCCLATNRAMKAISFFEMATRYFEPDGSTDPGIILSINKGLAAAYLAVNNVDSCTIFLRKAIDDAAIEMKDPDILANLLCMGADAFSMKCDYMKSLDCYRRGLSILDSHEQDCRCLRLKTELLTGRAELLSKMSQLTDSAEHCLILSFRDYQEAVRSAEQFNRIPGSRESKMIFNESLLDLCDAALNTGDRLQRDYHADLYRQLLEIAEAGRSRILFSGIVESDVRKLNTESLPSSMRDKLKQDQYVATSLRLNTNNEAGSGSEDLGQVMNLGKYTRPGNLMGQVSESSTGKSGTSVNGKETYDCLTPSKVKDVLGADDAFIEYFLGRNALFIFCITKDTSVIEKRDLPESFPENARDYFALLKTADTHRFSEISTYLYQLLISPVSPYLKNVKRLHLLPHRELSLIPFETLVRPGREDNSGGGDQGYHYLVKDYEIIYHNSAAIWCYDESSRQDNSGSMEYSGFAPVTGGDNRMPEGVTPLPAAFEEIRTISGLLGKNGYKTSVYFADEATEARFKNGSSRKKILHIATHCNVDEENPGNSGLLFPAKGTDFPEEEDGILRLDEIQHLTFDADLVVLSACSSGSGRISPSEGLLSLSRGFLFAGASTVLYSLWDIPDTFTRDFMVRFYSDFLTGKSYSAALRETKLSMIREKKTSLPLIWAGFIISAR